ncbi:hypothetical protein HBN50_03210 [Halobacteriovorax sp. GB3]|uniref:c-type cytochrome n=1 Tax=Halobacteriovorax sp. GB3 TaxID=2719615 RepID=UPI0023613B17|nr:hypothetical protein [Halobacteriovorax sp. GB3]MDD0852085.1 hypothetical protein [Halobacteriovorax sp. GB3]
MKAIILLSTMMASIGSFAYAPDWSANAKINLGETRENIYQLSEEDFQEVQKEGYIHALRYPVSVTGLLIPYRAMQDYYISSEESGLKKFLARLGKKLVGFNSEETMYQWLGLNPYNDEDATGIFKIPYPDGYKPSYYMGASVVDTKWGKGLTYSCATCHSATLFGKSVMGLTNKRPRANRYFLLAKNMMPFISTKTFGKYTNATEGEMEMFARTKKNLHSVGATKPQVLGLDTSLPQVALSLARRGKDEYATKSKFYQTFPSHNKLDTEVADSKPAVWWNLKYKTRWLSDGSIVQGNPILTNFLWNELGRGTDLKELETWMKDNQETIKELTVAAFSTKAPKWWDFFPVETISLKRAKRGEKIYENRCSKCHGSYIKGWSQEGSESWDLEKKLETVEVQYHEKTPVKDVGTDPKRYQGTEAFAGALNDLKISKWMKTVVVPQKGYVPPPLEGIWARYPYLHNNAIPSLCQLLTRAKDRVETFYQGPADNAETDFDSECVGYPIGNNIPKHFKKDKDAFYDTRREGMSNSGHERAFIGKNGEELLSKQEKMDLIMFLKTL